MEIFFIIFGLIFACVAVFIIVKVVKNIKNINFDDANQPTTAVTGQELIEKIKSKINQSTNGLSENPKSKCEYCGSVLEKDETKCSHCGATRKD